MFLRDYNWRMMTQYVCFADFILIDEI